MRKYHIIIDININNRKKSLFSENVFILIFNIRLGMWICDANIHKVCNGAWWASTSASDLLLLLLIASSCIFRSIQGSRGKNLIEFLRCLFLYTIICAGQPWIQTRIETQLAAKSQINGEICLITSTISTLHRK